MTQDPPPDTSIDKTRAVNLVVAKSPTYTIKGSLTLTDSDIGGSESYCYGKGGYQDLSGSLPITIKNGKGEILATGSTNSGIQPQIEPSSIKCVFEFSIDKIQKSDFYTIEIARRGQLNFSFDDLKKQNWIVALTIG